MNFAEKLRTYTLAIALVAVAAAGRWSLDLITEQTLTFATFYPAILLAALWGGLGPGIAAVILSTFAGWYAFMPPRWTFKAPNVDTEISIALYAICAALLVWIAVRYRQTLDKLHAEQTARELLIRELHHRNKNTLAVSQTIVNQTLKGDSELARKINGRLNALNAANDVLVGSDDQTARLSDLIRNEVAPYGAERVRMKGPPLRLSSQDSRSLSLLVHELATNAAKYGALSNAAGVIDVHWTFEGRLLTLTWEEADGPQVREPEKGGFGSQLIRTLATSLNGSVTTHYRPAGISCTILLEPGMDTALTTSRPLATAR
jgi:two-component sensor histidine kinase